METKLLNIQGKEQGKVNLPEALFGVKPNPTFLHEVITAVQVKNPGNKKAQAAQDTVACAHQSGATAVWLLGLPRTLSELICPSQKDALL